MMPAYILIGLLLGVLVFSPAQSDVLRVGWVVTAPTEANPFARDEGGGLRWAIYDGLSWFDANGTVKPRLAVRWENETPTTWLFHLREGISFSNGEPFDAASAVATFDALLDPEDGHPRVEDLSLIESYEAREANVLEVATKQPDPLLPNRLALLPMIAPNAWADKGTDQYAKDPVGTGPYTAVSWGPNNTRAIIEHVPSSWRPVGDITRVEFTVIPEPASRMSALLTNAIDVASSIASDDIPMLESAGFKRHVIKSPNILSMAFRTVRDEFTPLADPIVRRALNHAVNKDAIAQILLGGIPRVSHQPAVPELPGYSADIQPFEFNQEKARDLLFEAGYADGFPLKFYVFGNLTPNDTLVFQQVGQNLREIGIDAEIQQIAFPDFVRRLFNGDWEDADGFSLGWMNHVLRDPQRSLEQYSCSFAASFYCDQDLVPLINAAGIEMDPNTRRSILEEVVTKLHDRAAALWLVDFSGSMIVRSDINVGDVRIDGAMYETMSFRGGGT